MDNRILNYFLGKLNPSENLAFLEELQNNDELKKEFIHFRNITALTKLSNTDAQNNIDEGKINYDIFIQKREKEKSRKTFRRILKYASVACILILISVVTTLYYSSTVQSQHTEIATNTLYVPAAQRAQVTLPDGTVVWINSKSTLKYPTSFDQKDRIVYLEGQAFFDVAKNEDVPFIVKTKEGSVKALGTAFDVVSDSSIGIFETMLMEGSVEVELSTDPNQKVILKPNMKAITQNNLLSVTQTEDSNPYEWRNGLISFRNKEFKEIMAILEKTYDVKITLNNPHLGNQVFTGKFRISDGVQYALDVLSLYRKITYRIDYENHTIYIE